MIVRERMPAPTFAERRAAVCDCLPSVAVTAVTGVALYLAILEVDPTPHVAPDWPVGLTVGAVLAFVAQGVALWVRYRDHLGAQRRRRAARLAEDRRNGPTDGPTPMSNLIRPDTPK